MMAGDGTNELKWADYLVLSSVLLMSLVIGILPAFFGDRQRTVEGFLVANKQLNYVAVAASMLMSYSSAIMVLGNVAEMYMYGTQQMLSVLASCVGYAMLSLILVPVLYPLRLVSTYQYFALRFDSKYLPRLLSVVNIGDNTFYSGLAMYAPSIALAAVTDLPYWVFILCTGVLTTIYTAVGGMRATVWTDSFQGIIFFGGIISVLVLSAIEVGGLGEMWRVSGDGGRVIFTQMSLDPTVRVSFWNSLVAGCFYEFVVLGVGQSLFQRFNSVATLRDAQVSLLLNIPFIVLLNVFIALIGLCVYVYYEVIGCDPLRAESISSSNQLLPYFIVNVLDYPGYTGLLIAILFSGSLSTISSCLSSISANLWKDLLEPSFMDRDELFKARVTKIIVLVSGVAGTGVAFLVHVLPGHVNQVSNAVFGSTGGAMSGALALGIFFPFGTSVGAIAGIVVSFVFMLWVNVGQFMSDPFQARLPTNVDNCTLPGNTTVAPPPQDPDDVFPLYNMSFRWFGLVSYAISLGVGLTVSLATVALGKQNEKPVDPKLIVPVMDQLCCCLPKRWRQLFWCGSPPDDQQDKLQTGEHTDSDSLPHSPELPITGKVRLYDSDPQQEDNSPTQPQIGLTNPCFEDQDQIDQNNLCVHL